MRKTKIICTLGLASNTKEVIGALIDAGMDVARFNFSHGDHESHKKTFDIVKKLSRDKNTAIATLLDTKGPEVRLGMFKDGKATLSPRSEFILTTNDIEGDSGISSISYKELHSDVNPGDSILLDDGLIELAVRSIKDKDIICEVIVGGEISNRKGVNIPGVDLNMPYLSEQDKKDIIFGIKEGFDFIAASFVRSAADVLEMREFLHEHGGDDIIIISKIENAQGVDHIDEILSVSGGIMIARGDMGVEINFELLPQIQKLLIQKCYQAGKMVITATQMLESMINNPRPTRAEATDVANAIYDGTSAIMLSGETAAGKYPVKAVQTMVRIALSTEDHINYKNRFLDSKYDLDTNNVTNAISHATCTTAYDLGAAAIITVSLSGMTARNISKYRPDIPIICCTASEKAYRQLALSWGVTPLKINISDDLDALFEQSVQAALDSGLIKIGDLVAITTGVPLAISGTTNLLKVHIAGDVLLKGRGIGNGTACGHVCVAGTDKEVRLKFKEKDILVVKNTNNNIMSEIKKAGAIITEEDSLNSHAAIVGLSLGIPVILGAKNATNLLKSGTIISVDGETGFISNCKSIKK